MNPSRVQREVGQAREEAARLGLLVTATGLVLHVGLLIALGTVAGIGRLQLASVTNQVVLCLVVHRWGARLPARTRTVLVVLLTPVTGAIPSSYPQATIVGVPDLFLFVVIASRFFSVRAARWVTVEAVGVNTWIAADLPGGPALAVVQVPFVAGVLVLPRETLRRAGQAQTRLMALLQEAADVDGLTGLMAAGPSRARSTTRWARTVSP